MGLSDVMARWAVRRAHVLVVEVPGHWRTRAAVERAVLTDGRHLAQSPADADVLAVCGSPGSRLSDAVERVWHEMPGPRVRVEVPAYDDVVARLDAAYDTLLDGARHRDDARSRPDGPALLRAETDQHDDGSEHGDHAGMEMAPGGIPLAGGGEDRDGLELDELTPPLGPVLSHWPAGLVLRCSLQGDVVRSARAELLDGERAYGADDAAARTVDNVQHVLALAGWDAAAAQARAARDALVEHGPDRAAGRLSALSRRVRRSRVLRWSLRDLRPLRFQEIDALRLPGDLAGDTHDRLLRMLDRAEHVVATGASCDGDHDADPSLSVEQLAPLVTGLDLAAARLVVASLDIHRLTPGSVEREASHA